MNDPIVTAPLFEELDTSLIELLESLSVEDWRRPTLAPAWNVKQVAAHLLDTALRRLSFGRDGEQRQRQAIRSERDIVDLVNGLNAQGVSVYGGLSPRVLISLLRIPCRDLHAYLSTLDPMAPAAIAVSWAGEVQSPNWFDIAREFTERWHHQAQIRLAVDRPGIMTPRLYTPVLACFMRALPHAYRDLTALPGQVVEVRISGDSGGAWSIRRDADRWSFLDTPAGAVVSTTTIPQEIAWRIFTKGMPPAAARPHVSIEGDERLGSGVLRMLSIVG
jgi:uncharacterized protein (TIGR03083 family)